MFTGHTKMMVEEQKIIRHPDLSFTKVEIRENNFIVTANQSFKGVEEFEKYIELCKEALSLHASG